MVIMDYGNKSIGGSTGGLPDRDGRDGSVPAHGGRREEAASRYGIPKEELLDFSASINLLGPPPAAMSAIKGAAAEVSHYPEEEPAAMAAAAARHLGISPREVVMGNGSIELIYWLALALEPRRVMVIEPTFSEYRRACQAAGARCDTLLLPEDGGFALDVDLVEPAGYDLIFLCNPNNPTGYLAPLQDVVSLWRRCRAAGAGLVVDEAFIEFSGAEQSILSKGVFGGLYVLRSLTKSHALAGLRLGCLAAEADFASRLKGRMPPWNINAFALAAGRASLADSGYPGRTLEANSRARQALFGKLSAIKGIEPLPSEANYLLCRLEKMGSEALADRLMREGILVRDCRSFTGLGDRYIRVAVRAEGENYHLVSAIRRIMAQSGSREAVAGSRD
jgi:threonine-phosphate decarboxylase